MKNIKITPKNIILILIFSFCILLCGCDNNSNVSLPSENNTSSNKTVNFKLPEATGKETIEKENILIDISNIQYGYIMVKNLDTSKKIKISISKNDEEYIYDLNNEEKYDVFPLQMGNGLYSIKVYENVSGDKYTPLFEEELEVNMPDINSVFVYPSQYIWYKNGDRAIEISNKVCEGANSEKEKIEAIYNYVVDYLEYDYEKAKTVEKGYIPDIGEILDIKKGICFDYAALFASMLRVQNIPVELVMGYVQPEGIYHAWNQAYIDGAWYFFDTTFGPNDTHKSEDYEKDKYY